MEPDATLLHSTHRAMHLLRCSSQKQHTTSASLFALRTSPGLTASLLKRHSADPVASAPTACCPGSLERHCASHRLRLQMQCVTHLEPDAHARQSLQGSLRLLAQLAEAAQSQPQGASLGCSAAHLEPDAHARQGLQGTHRLLDAYLKAVQVQ